MLAVEPQWWMYREAPALGPSGEGARRVYCE